MFKNPDHESALLETGYRKPLFTLVMADTLKAQVLLKVKPELDQFCEGLSTCNVNNSETELCAFCGKIHAPMYDESAEQVILSHLTRPYPRYAVGNILSAFKSILI